MPQTTSVNHHACIVFPFQRTENGIELLFEVKDNTLLPPFFNAGLNALGGNNAKEDESPMQVLQREVEEEFWLRSEPPGETYNTILQQEVAESLPQVSDHPFPVADIREAGKLIIQKFQREGADYGRDFQMTVSPPILRQSRTYLVSSWFTPLSREEMMFIKELIGRYYGILTTDNVRYAKDGHRLAVVGIYDINRDNRKFAWGQEQILTRMLETCGRTIGASEEEQRGITRQLRFIDCRDLGHQPLGSFQAYEQQGYAYANRQVPATS